MPARITASRKDIDEACQLVAKGEYTVDQAANLLGISGNYCTTLMRQRGYTWKKQGFGAAHRTVWLPPLRPPRPEEMPSIKAIKRGQIDLYTHYVRLGIWSPDIDASYGRRVKSVKAAPALPLRPASTPADTHLPAAAAVVKPIPPTQAPLLDQGDLTSLASEVARVTGSDPVLVVRQMRAAAVALQQAAIRIDELEAQVADVPRLRTRNRDLERDNRDLIRRTEEAERKAAANQTAADRWQSHLKEKKDRELDISHDIQETSALLGEGIKVMQTKLGTRVVEVGHADK